MLLALISTEKHFFSAFDEHRMTTGRSVPNGPSVDQWWYTARRNTHIYYALCVCSALSHLYLRSISIGAVYTLYSSKREELASLFQKPCLHLRNTAAPTAAGAAAAHTRISQDDRQEKRNKMKQHKNHLYARVRVVFAERCCAVQIASYRALGRWLSMAWLSTYQLKWSWRTDVWNGSQHYLFMLRNFVFFFCIVVHRRRHHRHRLWFFFCLSFLFLS